MSTTPGAELAKKPGAPSPQPKEQSHTDPKVHIRRKVGSSADPGLSDTKHSMNH